MDRDPLDYCDADQHRSDRPDLPQRGAAHAALAQCAAGRHARYSTLVPGYDAIQHLPAWLRGLQHHLRVARGGYRLVGLDVHDLADRADWRRIQCHAVPARVPGERTAGIERNTASACALKRVLTKSIP